MTARIFRPAKTAMQSGNAGTFQWVLEFSPSSRREADPLMGWTAGSDTRRQLRLIFESKEAAIAYAAREGIAYTLEEPNVKRVQPKAYADNFRYDRTERWTH
jgi:ETC complex I subunit conserved region